MCERARRSRDASSRYSIDTLFPGLSNNSTHACNNNTTEETCVGGEETDLKRVELVSGERSMAESAENGSEVGGTDGGGEGGAGPGFQTPAGVSSPSPPILLTTATPPTPSLGGGSGSGRKRNQNNNGSYNGNNHKGRQGKRGPADRLAKEGKSSRSCKGSLDNNNGGSPVSKLNSVGSRGSPSSSGSSSTASSSTNGNSAGGRGAPRSTGSGTGVGRKRAGSPLKPTTIQAKQMSLLSTSKMSRKSMYEGFQPWVLRTYGDSAKTKTITKKKYCRIVKTLRGEEINNAENSKFRFWVKAKGFHIGPPPGHPHLKDDFFPFAHNNNNGDEGGFGCFMDPELYVPTTVKDGSSVEKSVYKRVAVVEYFFDIIYTVHVETEAKNGKHAGQKRTYRAITEKYAFLPREAVTKFLLQCMECQKRGSPGGGANLASGAGAIVGGESIVSTTTSNGKVIPVDSSTPSPDSSGTTLLTSHHTPLHQFHLLEVGTSSSTLLSSSTIVSTPTTTNTPEASPLALAVAERHCTSNGKLSPVAVVQPFDINFSLPFTTTYLRHQEQQQRQVHTRLHNGFKQEPDDEEDDEDDDDEDAEDVHMSDANSEEDHEPRVKTSKVAKGKNGTGDSKVLDSSSGTPSDLSATAGSDWLGYHPLGLKKEPPPPPNPSNNNIYSNGKHDFREQSSPLSLSERGGTNHEVVQDETSSNGNKEDEDDDDDDSEDKMDTHQYDPERLKAFNMFVRLFVDENLDRMVPISKQPKEKIQAIIDSCTRQFPEFAERARKRIRTYLKSCRRNKRSRDTNGWESSRPTPAHLTSVQAEQILAQACENESQNAKRMRMGLEPVSQPLPIPLGESRSSKENGHSNSGRDSSTPEKSQCKSSPAAPPAAHSISSGGGGQTATSSVGSASPGLSSDGMNNQNCVGGTSAVEGILGQQPSNSANKSLERSPLVDYSRTLNGNGVPNMSMYRPNFGQAFPRTAPFPSLFPPATAAAVAAATAAAAVGATSSFPPNVSPLPATNGDAGPTDLSMKNKPLLTHKLNPTELATVRQLITGYRESAAFLLRSADELEQLLIQQQ